ncbi:hypothetical protein GLOTRDRAFT_127095 [Gloeophyllum trabeum ATCC 11539]|uniref:Uncharacterized protein n=1 Tax=Gloeophyllum trabeum (strain ATCC 11539 / FP-39264 / Madison 617) TaxID=670483 RepID=S7QH70_GLOTA|nr:uncharacterized protein GLOTRDRAFT_127095 [Gloeophyllum trabeum ATCC 11539]EPQ58598.1 hypothetical protein GLOTRDRAFT_127095 [Gloeophyllum trabeum ATCC 11539]
MPTDVFAQRIISKIVSPDPPNYMFFGSKVYHAQCDKLAADVAGSFDRTDVSRLQGALLPVMALPFILNILPSPTSRSVFYTRAIEKFDENVFESAGFPPWGAGEARQTSWIHSAVDKGEPWSGPYQTPFTPSGAYSFASPFITSCPESNPPLPVCRSISPSMPKAGSTIKVSVDKSDSTGMFMAYYFGLSVLSLEIQDGQMIIPEGLQDVVFARVVSEKPTEGKPPSDETIRSGLVVIDFGLPADAKYESPM